MSGDLETSFISGKTKNHKLNYMKKTVKNFTQLDSEICLIQLIQLEKNNTIKKL